MSNTLIASYLGQGLAAARPATPTIDTGCIAFYYATDTGVLSAYENGAWSNSVGGGKRAQAATLQGTTSSQSHASIGQIIRPQVSMKVDFLSFLITTVTSATYKIGIAPYNTSTNQITSAPTYGDATVSIVTGATHSIISATFAVPFAMTAGSAYLIFFVRTDGTSTTATTIEFVATIQTAPGLYFDTSSLQGLSSLTPLTSDTWSNLGSGVLTLGMAYSL